MLIGFLVTNLVISFACLLGMLIDNMEFDLFVAPPLGDFVVVNKILRDWV